MTDVIAHLGRHDGVFLQSNHVDSDQLRYAQLHQWWLDNSFADYIASPNTRVASLLSHPAYAAVALHAFAARCVYCPLPSSLSATALDEAWSQLQFDVLLTDNPSSEALALLAARGVQLATVVASSGGWGLFQLQPCPQPGVVALPTPDISTLAAPQPPCLLLRTSGTTALPKVVELQWDTLIAAVGNVAGCLNLTPQDIGLNSMPLYHLHGLAVNIGASAVAGARVVLAPFLNGTGMLQALCKHECTWYSAVPAIHAALVQAAAQQPTLCPQLRLIRNCSAPLPPPLALQLAGTFGCQVLPTYAMTECLPITSPAVMAVSKWSEMALCEATFAAVGASCGVELGVLPSGGNREVCSVGEGEVLLRGKFLNRYLNDCCKIMLLL